MRLEEFVSESLAEIVRGVHIAQNNPDLAKARINPPGLTIGQKVAESSMYDYHTGLVAQMIEFDLAVTAERGKETKGGIGVFMGSFGVGSQGQSDTKDTSISRIRFKVPMILPLGK